MKILVGVKHVIDYNVSIRIKTDGSGVVSDKVKMSINPFDEVAVEAAVRLKETANVDEVIVATVGSTKAEETLRTALAMGADRGILLAHHREVEPLGVAKLFKQLVEKEKIGLVILGKQAIDDDANQTGQMLAALLNWPQATFASHIEINADKANVTREIDGGTEVLAVSLPCVITADLRLNAPRFASLPNIMQARKKPVEKLNASDFAGAFGIDLAPRLQTLSLREPEKRRTGVTVADVAELIDRLKNDTNVIS
ncbi:MAG: electron transfer flavoprotein subunit beta [Gammaproteobacteria bacterium]|nr:MAG: electron transfer flavoprotein subunit beta [Gammaproteobacteria bacterium]